MQQPDKWQLEKKKTLLGQIFLLLRKNSVNLMQKELDEIAGVWESMKDHADSFLQEYKWTNIKMASCRRNLADTY